MDVPESNEAAITSRSQQQAHSSDLNQTRTESDIEHISSSLARLSSTSIEGLEGFTSELLELQKFLKIEVERVHEHIESALAGIKIITEIIAPFRASVTSPAPSVANARVVRSGVATWPKAS
jgi:hypothetical protein